MYKSTSILPLAGDEGLARKGVRCNATKESSNIQKHQLLKGFLENLFREIVEEMMVDAREDEGVAYCRIT